MTIKGASDLHQALYAAIEENNADAFNNLVQRYFDEIMVEFDSWATVPESIRADQEAATRYVQSLIAIAKAFESAGEPALIERLVGSDENNPIVRWNRHLSHAQALSEVGEYAACSNQLKEVLAEMEDVTGTAVVDLQPKIFGRLGFNALHEQDYDAALDYTTRAYDACLAAQDEDGIITYYENLMSLRVIQAFKVEPERGQLLLRMRRFIAQAQDSADAGRYQASTDKLFQALSIIQNHSDDELFRAHLPKVYGLLGFNGYRLGNVPEAREHTALALKESGINRDADGVRIYTANLEVIDSG